MEIDTNKVKREINNIMYDAYYKGYREALLDLKKHTTDEEVFHHIDYCMGILDEIEELRNK